MANELSQVRTYLDARIAAVDSDFKAHSDAFNFDNVPRSLFNKCYHLLPGVLTSTPLQDLIVTDLATWELRLFFKGFRDPQDAMDSALDTAHLIREQVINPANIKASGDNIKQAILTSLEPRFVGTNDNAIIILMVWQFEMVFSGCG